MSSRALDEPDRQTELMMQAPAAVEVRHHLENLHAAVQLPILVQLLRQ